MPLATVFLLVALAANGAAQPPDEVRARVRALLGAIDRPVSPESLRAVGPGADDALADIALSEDFAPLRARALEALVALRSPRAAEVHRRVAGDTRSPRTVRRSAVRGLAHVVAPGEAEAMLRPLLEKDRDGAIRATAAEALARAEPSRGCAAVRAQTLRERPEDRGRFRRALAMCGGAERR